MQMAMEALRLKVWLRSRPLYTCILVITLYIRASTKVACRIHAVVLWRRKMSIPRYARHYEWLLSLHVPKSSLLLDLMPMQRLIPKWTAKKATRVVPPRPSLPEPPYELVERLTRFHASESRNEKSRNKDEPEEHARSILRWMQESPKCGNETDLKHMVDEYVDKRTPLAYILGKSAQSPRSCRVSNASVMLFFCRAKKTVGTAWHNLPRQPTFWQCEHPSWTTGSDTTSWNRGMDNASHRTTEAQEKRQSNSTS